MKRMLTLLVALLAFSSAASTDIRPSVGLFSDYSHSECSVFANLFTPFDAWLWWTPGPGGIMGVECAIECPSNVVLVSKTYHPELQSQLVDCCEGLECSCFYSTCHTDWVYVFRLTFLLLDNASSVIDIVPYPPSGGINAATCEPGYPIVPATLMSGLYINAWCFVAVEESTWGAVKSLYR